MKKAASNLAFVILAIFTIALGIATYGGTADQKKHQGYWSTTTTVKVVER